MSDNWVVQNLENALETWNEKLAEIWQLITTTPQDFKGGGIWGVIVNINGAVQSIGLALLVLFFVAGMVKTCGSFTEVKKPEHALKLFVRFAIAKGAITYGMIIQVMSATEAAIEPMAIFFCRAFFFCAASSAVFREDNCFSYSSKRSELRAESFFLWRSFSISFSKSAMLFGFLEKRLI